MKEEADKERFKKLLDVYARFWVYSLVGLKTINNEKFKISIEQMK